MRFVEVATDVLVIGAGAAGLRAAISARSGGAEVVILHKTKGKRDSCSTMAAGWITQCPPDCSEEFEHQVVTVGGFLNEPRLAHVLAEDVVEAVPELEEFGVELLTPDGCGPRPPVPGLYQVKHEAGTPPGSGLTGPLAEFALNHGVRFLDGTAVAILAPGGRARGVVALDPAGTPTVIGAGAVVLASGGGACIFGRTDNPPGNTGDGFSLAYRCGARLVNMEFVSLVVHGDRLVELVLKDGEKRRDEILSKGFAHYFLGGAEMDADGRTSVPGLYACGEVTGGVLGALRLGGSAPADAIVFGRRAGRAVVRDVQPPDAKELVSAAEAEIERLRMSVSANGTPADRAIEELSRILWGGVGPVKNEQSLLRAQERIAAIRERGVSELGDNLAPVAQVLSICDVGELIIAASLLRKETRGAFWRTDYPEPDNEQWLRTIRLQFAKKPVLEVARLAGAGRQVRPIIAAGCHGYLEPAGKAHADH